VKNPAVVTTVKPAVVKKTEDVPQNKVIQKATTQTALPTVPQSQVVDIKKVEKEAKQANKNIIKKAEALGKNATVASEQVENAKKKLVNTVNESFNLVNAAIKEQSNLTKNFVNTLEKFATPIKPPKTSSGKKILKIAIITDKDAQAIVSNPGGGTAQAAMRDTHNIVNAREPA
jgi:hypothetical protein